MNRRVTWVSLLVLSLTLAVAGCAKKTEKTDKTDQAPKKPVAGKNDKKRPGGGSTPVAGNNGKTQPTGGGSTPVAKNNGKAKSAGGGSSPVAANPIDTAYITDDFVGAVVVHPARVLQGKLVQDFLKEVRKVAGDNAEKEIYEKASKEFGIDPRNIEQVIFLFDQTAADAATGEMLGTRRRRRSRKSFERKKELDFKSEPGRDGPPSRKEGGARKEFDRNDRQDGKSPFQHVSLLQDKGPAFKGKGEFREPSPRDEPKLAFIVRTVQPVPDEAIVKFLTRKKFVFDSKDPRGQGKIIEIKPTKGTHSGKTYFVAQDRHAKGAVCRVDDKTLVGAQEPMLKKMLDAKPADTPLTRMLRSLSRTRDLIVAFDATATAANIKKMKLPRDRVPPLVAKAVDYAEKMQSVAITASLSDKTFLSLVVKFPSEADAKGLAALVNDEALPQGKKFYRSLTQGDRSPLPPSARPLLKLADELIQGLSVTSRNDDFVISIARPADLDKLPTLALPAIRAARDAARMAARKNNLHQIAIAMHNFHDRYHHFPTADSNGERRGQGRKAGLSWRVYILPYLEQKPLYDQFHLDEPWDSPHNKTLINRMPAVFLNPESKKKREEGKTSIHVFVGKGTPFGWKLDGQTRMISIRDILDGTSNTLMAVEAGDDKAEAWTKPGGLPFDPKKNPLDALGKLPGDGFLAVFCDGLVAEIKKTVKPETFRNLIQHQDGNPIGEIPGVRRKRFEGYRKKDFRRGEKKEEVPKEAFKKKA